MRNLECTEERMKRKRKKFKARNQNGGVKDSVLAVTHSKK